MTLPIPELSLVVLVGVTGSGKSSFAAKRFAPTEILSSDRFRAMVADDETDQSVSAEAFAALHLVAEQRLRLGKLTVIDATNVTAPARAPLLRIAREQHVPAIAIVLDVPVELAIARNRARAEKSFGAHVVHHHHRQLEESRAALEKEGFAEVFALEGASIDAATIVRTRAPVDRRDDHGPFDVIGDVHGCAAELRALLAALGWREDASGTYAHPDGRAAVFLGDLVDRGPDVPGVLRIAMAMVRAGRARCVEGNHEAKLARWLAGKTATPTHGLAASVEQLEREPDAFREEVRHFLDGLDSHYVLDAGRLVVAHAGLVEAMHGRDSGRVRAFARYGQTTGESDDLGLPVRLDWARDYRGSAAIVYGHTPVARARWRNDTICIDTGCVFGGALTALRWPERELVSVPASAVHYAPARPLADVTEALVDPFAPVADVTDGIAESAPATSIETRFAPPVTLRARSVAAARERRAVDPRWLVYLPPTLALDAPAHADAGDALRFYLERGVPEAVVEPFPRGARVVLVVCRDEEIGRARFGDARLGAISAATAQPAFEDTAREAEVVRAVRDAAVDAGLFEALASGWLILEAELDDAGTLTPIHLLASHGRAHLDRDHAWRREQLARLAEGDARIARATWRRVALADERARDEAARTIETYPVGAIVRPLSWTARDERGLLPPMLVVRPGAPSSEKAVGRAARLAIRQHALGLEALARFVVDEPIERVHECVLGILALAEDVLAPGARDPR